MTDNLSYVGGERRCAPVSYGKQNTAEMPREFHVWHARRKCGYEDFVGVWKIIEPLKIFPPRVRLKEEAEESADLTLLWALVLYQTAQC